MKELKRYELELKCHKSIAHVLAKIHTMSSRIVPCRSHHVLSSINPSMPSTKIHPIPKKEMQPYSPRSKAKSDENGSANPDQTKLSPTPSVYNFDIEKRGLVERHMLSEKGEICAMNQQGTHIRLKQIRNILSSPPRSLFHPSSRDRMHSRHRGHA